MTDNGSILVEYNLTQFPSRFTWHCHHTWTDGSVQLDGYVIREGFMHSDQLDIIATLDEGFAEYNFDPDDAPGRSTHREVRRRRRAARRARIAVDHTWSEGAVYTGHAAVFGATTLLLPFATLNVTVVTEALRRYGLDQGW